MRKRAFTLVEVLVVLVIIAIMAAILFAVSSQARESAMKVSAIASYRQTGGAILLYATDHDDVFPLAFGTDGNFGQARWNHWHRVPAGWQANGVHDSPARIMEDSQMWANSTIPYARGMATLAQPGNRNYQWPNINYSQAVAPRAMLGLSMNGMLHGWPASAVSRPSELPVVWPGMYKQNLDGMGLTNPQLFCAVPGPCRFNPTGPPVAGGEPGYGYVWWSYDNGFTTWVYTKGMVFVSADMSARYQTIQLPEWTEAKTMTNRHPFSAFADGGGRTGTPAWMIHCVEPGGHKPAEPGLDGKVYYPGFFRPDSDFDYTLDQCDVGDN